MARKNLLRDLMTPPDPPQAGAGAAAPEVDSRQLSPEPARTRPPRGAIGAVGRSIADLKSRALLDLDPHLIDAGGLADRLEHDEADHARLMASLRDHGQQVPVLVRPHPETEGRYQIVYGRRRVLALRDLGLTVKALVRALDDRDLILAQGQENTARRDLSFIEKANFARQMVEIGLDRETACDALSVDKTVLSRMLSVTARVPVAVIAAIGGAPGIGRDRWLAFAELHATAPPDPEDARAILAISGAEESDARFHALEAWLASRLRRGGRGETPAAAPREILRAEDGTPLAEVSRGRGRLTLTLRGPARGGFEDWLADNLAELHRGWRAGHGDPDGDG